MRTISIPAHVRNWPERRRRLNYLAVSDGAIFVIRARSIHEAGEIASRQIGTVEVSALSQEALSALLNFDNGVACLSEVL